MCNPGCGVQFVKSSSSNRRRAALSRSRRYRFGVSYLVVNVFTSAFRNTPDRQCTLSQITRKLMEHIRRRRKNDKPPALLTHCLDALGVCLIATIILQFDWIYYVVPEPEYYYPYELWELQNFTAITVGHYIEILLYL